MSDSMAKGFGEGLLIGNAFAGAGSTAAAAGTIREMGNELIGLDQKLAAEKSRADKAERKVAQLERENEELRKIIEVFESDNFKRVSDAYEDAASLSSIDEQTKNNKIRSQAASIEALQERLLVSENEFLEFFARNSAKSRFIKKRIDDGVISEEEAVKELDSYVLELAETKPEIKTTGSYCVAIKNK